MNKNNNELVDFVVTARVYKTTLTEKYKKRTPWVAPTAGEVKAVLPGSIISLAVKVGDKVQVGDLLLIHEAMKMQNRILSPISGTVSKILVNVGNRIPKDTLLVVVE